MAGSITPDVALVIARSSCDEAIQFFPRGTRLLRFARNDGLMTARTATLIGLTAILLWSLLSVLTVATGKIPAFQLAAMTFAIGGLVGLLTWIGRGDAAKSLRQPLVVWLVGVGGLFGYHALYFAALRHAPPAARLPSAAWRRNTRSRPRSPRPGREFCKAAPAAG